MGLLASLFGLNLEPEVYCQSCRKCRFYEARRRVLLDRITGIKYFRMPDHALEASFCMYVPTDRGGCARFEPIIGFRSFFLDSFRDPVIPKPGSVVVCDLRLFILPGVDHSGIVDADGMVIHRDGEAGLIRSLPITFTERLNGLNGAFSIYVACNGHSAIGNEEALKRAESALNDPDFGGYDLFKNNCHQFVQYCLTGKRDADFTFSALEGELCQYHGMDNWRKWDIKLYDD